MDRCGQVRTTLAPGCLSKLAGIWRTGADRCGQLWFLGVSLSWRAVGGQVRTSADKDITQVFYKQSHCWLVLMNKPHIKALICIDIIEFCPVSRRKSEKIIRRKVDGIHSGYGWPTQIYTRREDDSVN